MPFSSDIARLNILIELFSECANASDLDAMLQVATSRMRWVIDYDRCLFVLMRRDERVCWAQTRVDEALSRVEPSSLSGLERTLVERVLETGAPAGMPPGKICVPSSVGGRATGAILFCSETTAYSYRDLRLGHHAGQYLGSLIARLDLEEDAKRLSGHKDDLLALLGHELRNPLAPITTAVHLLMARSNGSPSKELQIVARQTQHLVRLVDDLLDVARLTRGKMALQRKPVELAQIVALAVEIVSPLLEQRHHSLAIDVSSVGLVVDADVNRLAQVLSNLLSNAAHYTNPYGHLSVAAVREGESTAIEVCDDGVGIPTERMANIFDWFVQGSNQPDSRGGLGLGLVVVKQLTELHGGSVSVASRSDGPGTKFTLKLPLLPASCVAVAPTLAPLPAPTRERQRVLLVDDNQDALDLLSIFLESEGHEVTIARDGAEALTLLDQYQPSIAVIDITMPVMGGYELAKRIRAQAGGNELPLVALTGYGQASDRDRSRAAGFDEHLVKPVDLDLLLSVVARTERRPAKVQRSPA